MKIYYHILLLLAALLSSCATILNQPYEEIEVEYDTSTARLWINGVQHQSGDTTLLRSPEDLFVIAETESGLQSRRISPRSSWAYWLNAIYNFGLGLYLERDIPERWTYPTNTFLRVRNGVLEAWRNRPRPRGSVGLNVALPYINMFDLQRPNGKTSGGFVGFELGFAYYFAENSNVAFFIGAATDFFAPMGPVMIIGPWRSTSITYFDLRMAHLYDALELGGGISYGNIGWRIRQDTIPGITRGEDQSLAGLNLTAGYRLGNRGRLAVVYHPYFFRLDNGFDFKYQHHISFGWSVEIGRDRE